MPTAKPHAAVSLWLNAGVPALTVARRAGHSVEVLLRVYAACVEARALGGWAGHRPAAARAFRSALHGFVSLEASGGFGMPVSVGRSFGRLVHALVVALSNWSDASEPSREVPS